MVTSERQSVSLLGKSWAETEKQIRLGYAQLNSGGCAVANAEPPEKYDGDPESWHWLDPLAGEVDLPGGNLSLCDRRSCYLLRRFTHHCHKLPNTLTAVGGRDSVHLVEVAAFALIRLGSIQRAATWAQSSMVPKIASTTRELACPSSYGAYFSANAEANERGLVSSVEPDMASISS